jgi:toxin ParE1/3/4
VTLPIIFRPEAEREFDEAFDWYNARQPGLGIRFVAAVQAVFDSIAALPKMHAVVLADVRKAVVRRFTYCVFYRPLDDQIEVIAVFHTSRDPSIWQDRV